MKAAVQQHDEVVDVEGAEGRCASTSSGGGGGAGAGAGACDDDDAAITGATGNDDVDICPCARMAQHRAASRGTP